MKTPDEIKKGLQQCCDTGVSCTGCPYDNDCHDPLSTVNVEMDAVHYIHQLESRLAQVERERDAAVADLESVDEKYETLKSMIDDVTFNHEPYGLYLDFRAAADAIVEHEHADVWRGVLEENTKEE